MAKQSVVDLTKGTLNEENNEELEYVQVRHKRIREICDHPADLRAVLSPFMVIPPCYIVISKLSMTMIK